MSFTSIEKNGCWFISSKQLAANTRMIPATAQYNGVFLLLKKTPPNIMMIPQTAVIIIAFMLALSPQTCGALVLVYLNLVVISATALLLKSKKGCGYMPTKNIATTITLKIIFSFNEISLADAVNVFDAP